MQIRSVSAHSCWQTDRQTYKQIYKQWWKHNLPGKGNQSCRPTFCFQSRQSYANPYMCLISMNKITCDMFRFSTVYTMSRRWYLWIPSSARLAQHPTEDGASPVQRLMGRRWKHYRRPLIMLMTPTFDAESDAKATARKKQASRRHYNLGSRPLKHPKSGDVVLMKRPGPQIGIPAILSRNVAVRSYEVRVNGTTYRWNNRDLLWTNEPLLYLVMNWFQSTTDRLLLWKLHDHNTDISALFISDSQPAATWAVRHRTVNASEML